MSRSNENMISIIFYIWNVYFSRGEKCDLLKTGNCRDNFHAVFLFMTTNNNKRTLPQRFCSNSEADASDLLQII